MIYVAFDLETTGLRPGSDAIVEIGAVKFEADGTVIDTTTSLVRPGRPCSEGAFAAHGLTDAELDAAPDPGDVLPAFRDFLGSARDVTLLAHNARFELGFLRVAFATLGLPAITHDVECTLDMARTRLPGLPSYKLPLLAERFGFPGEDGHRALADAGRVRLLWMMMAKGGRP